MSRTGIHIGVAGYMGAGKSTFCAFFAGAGFTVIDADADPRHGTGFVAAAPDPVALLDAWHRAVRAWANVPRRRAIQRRAMAADWSWQEPARRYVELYEHVAEAHGGARQQLP